MNEKKSINVLLVEDNESHVELISRSFESCQFLLVKLTIAKTVQEARKILEESTPDLAIIDYKLPNGEGIELLQPKHSCPIIIMTGQGDEKVAVASLKAGALDYFVKSERMFKDMPHIAERILREWENIQKRKQAEEALRQYEHIVSSSTDMLALLDKRCIYIAVNKAYLEAFGKTSNELIGHKVSEVFGEEFFFKIIKPNAERCLAGEKVNYQSWFEFPVHGQMFMDVTYYPHTDINNKIAGFVVNERNITERNKAEEKQKNLEAQLRQSQKLEALGTLAGGIAHDFNNILTAIIGYTEISIDRLPEDSEISDHLSQVLKSSYRARDLVKQILTFSHQIEKELKPLELGSVVKEVLKLIRSSLPSTIEIRGNIGKETGIIVADLTQMHQLIMNLCVNAEHAMREKGGILDINLDSVNVDADLASTYTNLKEGPYMKLTVRDTGHGMDKKIAERVFDPFFTTKIAGEGTGLGLTTVHGIVLGHGGEITINSEPGKGTTFEVYLPKLETIPKKENLQPQPIPRGSERILLVDDEKTVLNVERKILENLGYYVVAKGSSLEAFETFKADPEGFDIVITDQTMPDMTGDEFAGELMRVRYDIPVILCTGFSHLITKEKVKTIGIRKLIMKPFNVRDLAVAIREALDKEK